MRRAKRAGWPLALLFLDLDNFKRVNDSLGHDAGDRLLRVAAERIRRAVREADMLFRMGGDEFTVLLEDVRGPEEAAMVSSRVLEAMAEPLQLQHHEISVTASIGIALYPRDDVVAERLLKSADTAMYRAKELGRNRYAFFAPEMNERVESQMLIEAALRRALKNQEFVLHFQPRVSAASGRATGAEALLRWRHPEWGLVEPARFVPLLEETGMVVPVGAWVLAEACRQAKAWQDAGLPPLRVSVNLSSRQFRSETLFDSVTEALRASRLQPQLLELELTESLLVENVEHAMGVMGKLKAIGTAISIDDFGTGYSSLGYLKRFPIDSLKIDKSFVRDIATSPKDAAIVKAISALARSLGIGLIAEGVEEAWQAEFLRAPALHRDAGLSLQPPAAAGAGDRRAVARLSAGAAEGRGRRVARLAGTSGDLRERADPFGGFVQAGDEAEVLAAGGAESPVRRDADFFQRLEAVAHESRADHVDPLQAFAGERHQRRLGVRLQPVGVAEARLERGFPGRLLQAELGGEQCRRRVALELVALRAFARQAVKAHHQHRAAAVLLPVAPDVRRQGFDVRRMLVEALHHRRAARQYVGARSSVVLSAYCGIKGND